MFQSAGYPRGKACSASRLNVCWRSTPSGLIVRQSKNYSHDGVIVGSVLRLALV